MPFNPFSALTSKIFGGVSIALALALGAMYFVHKSDVRANDELRNDLAMERAAHAITRQSVTTLETELARIMREAQERAEEYERNKRQAERNAARLAEKARTSEQRISMLMSVVESGDAACRVPDGLLAQLEGL